MDENVLRTSSASRDMPPDYEAAADVPGGRLR
jgi:hypothetical protein